MKLILGNMKYSSWSLRPWMLMRHFDLPFDLEVWDIFDDEGLSSIAKKYDVPAAVPLLIDDQGHPIWESLAIIDVLADRFLDLPIWPEDPVARATARSASAEMHAGFKALRSQCPMKVDLIESIPMTPALADDLARLAQLWRLFGQQAETGPYALGAFSALDAMFAPVAVRTRGYQLSVSPAYARWEAAIFALPALHEWFIAGDAEARQNPAYYVGEAVGPYELMI